MRRVGTLALLALAAFARAEDPVAATTAAVTDAAAAGTAAIEGAAAQAPAILADAGEALTAAAEGVAAEGAEAVAAMPKLDVPKVEVPTLDAVPEGAQSLTGAASGAVEHLATAGSHTASEGATVLVIPTLKQLTAIVKNDKAATAENGMGCYTVGDSTNQLSLLLCENDQVAQTVAKTEGGLDYAWVKGKLTNTGTTDLCQVSFSTATQDLHIKALEQLPATLPVLQPAKLAAGETMDFSFLLPMDKDSKLAVPSAPFVGLADTLAPCELLKTAEEAATTATDAAAAAPAAATDAATKAAAEAAAAAEAIANVVVDPATSIPKASDIIQAQVQDTTVEKEAISPAAKASASLVGVLTIAAIVAAQLLL